MTITAEPDRQTSQKNAVQERPIDQELLQDHLHLVRVVVSKISKTLPSHVDLDDLRSVGLQGLISAVRRYDPEQGKTFDGYAMMRIRGAILDELRRMDVMPRTARAKARTIQTTVAKLEQKLGRTPTDEELQAELNLSTKDFRRMMRHAKPVNFVSLDSAHANEDPDEANLHEAIPDDSQEMCYDKMQNEELKRIVAERISLLPERQKKILAMYYFEEMKLAEIAEVYGVTEARICQIHAQALGTLRKYVQSAKTN